MNGSFSMLTVIVKRSSTLIGSVADTPDTSPVNEILRLLTTFELSNFKVNVVIEVINISDLKKIGSDPVTNEPSPLNGSSDNISKMVSLRRGTRPYTIWSGVSVGPQHLSAHPCIAAGAFDLALSASILKTIIPKVIFFAN